jgi:ADP-ribose pyrophosphatase
MSNPNPNLVPTPIIDVTGKQTTVYKKMDTASGTSAEVIPQLGIKPSPTQLASTPIVENNSDAGTGVVFQNRYLSIDMVPSRFGAFTTVKNGTGRGAAVLLLRDGKVMMVRQPRYALGENTWELPRGGSMEGEDNSAAALRELREETGEDGQLEGLVSLGNIQPDTGILNTEAGLFMSTINAPAENHVDDGEIDNIMWVDADELVDACVDGTIKDSFTCVAVMRARLKGLI